MLRACPTPPASVVLAQRHASGIDLPKRHTTAHRTSFRYQSSSSSFFVPLIALCLARRASAKPPARLPLVLLGVARPLSVPDGVLKLTPLSRAGVGGGSACRPPAAGRFAGGMGGVGFALTAGAEALRMPLGTADVVV